MTYTQRIMFVVAGGILMMCGAATLTDGLRLVLAIGGIHLLTIGCILYILADEP